MIDSIMKDGFCVECGGKEQEGLSCSEQFGYLLAWEHNDPRLYALHFWAVSSYMLQHKSHFTREGYVLTQKLFCDAYDHNWETDYILKKNRELTTNKNFKIANPVPFLERERVSKQWTMTMSDIYTDGEKNAIENVLKWRKSIRSEL